MPHVIVIPIGGMYILTGLFRHGQAIIVAKNSNLIANSPGKVVAESMQHPEPQCPDFLNMHLSCIVLAMI